MSLTELLEDRKRKTVRDEELERELEQIAQFDEPEPEEPQEETASGPGLDDGDDGTVLIGPEQLSEALLALDRRIGAMEQRAEMQDRLLGRVGSDADRIRRRTEDDDFIRGLREEYERDPAAGTARIVARVRGEIMESIPRMIEEAFREHRTFKRLLGDFLDEPGNEDVKPYARQIEHFMRDLGIRPQEAVGIIRARKGDGDRVARMRAAAAKEVRNRAAVETGGQVGEPADKDKELDRIIKKAKTVEDLFEALRRADL